MHEVVTTTGHHSYILQYSVSASVGALLRPASVNGVPVPDRSVRFRAVVANAEN